MGVLVTTGSENRGGDFPDGYVACGVVGVRRQSSLGGCEL